MVRVMICCGGGFSSSVMARSVAAQIKEKQFEDKLSITFYPMGAAWEKLDEVDVIFCCPHLAYKLPDYVEKFQPKIPFYVLPSLMYGRLFVEDVYEDALMVIEGYQKTGMNPYHFPGEQKVLSVKRQHSYKRSVIDKGSPLANEDPMLPFQAR